MRAAHKFTLFSLILILLASPALAQEAIPVCLEDDFIPRGIRPAADGTFLMCGEKWANGHSYADGRPFLLTFDVNGRVLWSMETGDQPNGFYRDAVQIDEDELLALLASQDSEGFVVQHIVGGRIVDQTGGIPNAFGLTPVSDGCLLNSKPNGRYAALITKCTFEGALSWQLEIDGRIVFQDVLVGDDCCVAYGSCIPPDDISGYDPPAQGIAVAFSHDGQLLWRYDSMYTEAFCGAAWSPDGYPVLISCPTEADVCALTGIDQSGALWRSEFHDIFEMYDLLTLPDGYLVAVSGQSVDPDPKRPNSTPRTIRLLHCDLSGTLLNEWQVTMGSITNYSQIALTRQNGGILLLSSGQIVSEIWEQMWSTPGLSVSDIPYVTMIRKIELPQ